MVDGDLDAFSAELALCEPALTGCRALRLSAVVAAPLAAAACLPTAWFVALCWLLALWLFFPLLRGWGYSYLAVLVAVLPWYLLASLQQASVWAVAASSAVTIAMARYLKLRLERIQLYRLAQSAPEPATRAGHCSRVRF